MKWWQQFLGSAIANETLAEAADREARLNEQGGDRKSAREMRAVAEKARGRAGRNLKDAARNWRNEEGGDA